MRLLLEIKKRVLVRRFSSRESFGKFFRDLDLNTPVREATFVVFDTETTGLDPKRAELVSIGALKIRNLRIELASAFHRFVKPSSLDRNSVEIHGITWEDLESKGEEPERVMESFLEYIKGAVLVGFNVEFDRRMVEKYTLGFFGIPLLNYRLEVFQLWRKRGGQETDLRGIAEELEIPVAGLHSAIDDAYITSLIFLKLVHRMKDEPLKVLPLML